LIEFKSNQIKTKYRFLNRFWQKAALQHKNFNIRSTL
jgi:hypothetical protein